MEKYVICSSHTDMKQHSYDLNKICDESNTLFHYLYMFQISFKSIYVYLKIKKNILYIHKTCTLDLYCHHGYLYLHEFRQF